MQHQSKQGPQDPPDDTAKGARVIRIGRRRIVTLAQEVVPELTVEELGAAVIALAWINDIEDGKREDFDPEDLAERIGCSAEHAAKLMVTLHSQGIIFWGQGPFPAWAYPDLDDDEQPVRAPAPPPPLRSLELPPEWSGPWPFGSRGELPPPRANVAYALYGVDKRCLYVGSTNSPTARIATHAGNGREFVRWEAYRCESREAAYAFEHALNLALRPTANPRSDTLAQSAYARAVAG
jgi:hypothetical protein